MQKLRNKNRLIGLAVVFALLFTIGAVFALADGTIDIEGRFYVTDVSEVSDDSAISTTPSAITIVTTTTPSAITP